MAESELALLQQYASTQDAFAFRKLVEQHQDMVFAACHRVLGNRTDAEDAAQNCFLKLAQAAGRLKAPIAGWLHTVAVRSAIDMLRGETARRAREHAVARDAARARVESPWADLRGEVDAAIVALPARLRTPLVLYFLEGRTQAEIAVEMGIVHQSVSKRLQRAVEALRRRLKRGGIMTSAVALPTMLSGNAVEAAPATLVANLGKVALAGTSSVKAAATVGGTLATLKTAAALVVAAGVGAGAVAIHHATIPPHPTPLAAAAPPVVKKVPLTRQAVLDAELTLKTGTVTLNELGALIEKQIGVNLAGNSRLLTRLVHMQRGKQKMRDVLTAIAAAAPVTIDVADARDRMVICLWQKPEAKALAEMLKLAASDDVVERCTAARWLSAVGGRDALVQLCKMLTDPDARVRHFAMQSIADEWTSRYGLAPRSDYVLVPSDLLLCTAPKSLGLTLVTALETETRPQALQNLFRIAYAMRDPEMLPTLKRLMEKTLAENSTRDFASKFMIGRTIARIGGDEALSILLATQETLERTKQNSWWIWSLVGTLGSDAAIAQLGRQIDVEAQKGKRADFRFIVQGLASSGNPAAVRELIRITELPDTSKAMVDSIFRYFSNFDTPEARTACLARLKAATDPAERWELIPSMARFPAVQKMLFDKLAAGGADAHKAAMALRYTYDPRLVPAFAEMLAADLDPVGIHVGAALPYVLGRTDSPEAEKILIALSKPGGDVGRRHKALSALGYRSRPEAREVLRAALQDPDSRIRQSAADALVMRLDPADMDCMLACARTKRAATGYGDSTPWIIWKAIAKMGGERATRELLTEAAKGNITAVRILTPSRDPHCIKALRDALAGNDAKLRELMMANSGDIFSFRTEQPLGVYYLANAALADLHKVDEKLKVKRTQLLGWTQDPRGTDVLGKLLVNAEEPVAVRRAAAEGLYRNGCANDPVAVEPMRHAYEHDTDEKVKKRAKEALIGWKIIQHDRAGNNPDRPRRPVPKDPPDEREFPPPPEP